MAMNKILLYVVFILLSLRLSAQFDEPVLLTNIDQQVEETSGIVFHNNELWTHNDSGGDAILYSIDTATGEVVRSVQINNATNNDWEDICKDENYLYIGDFGNNSGARDDLKVYRISLEELENPENTSIDAEIINFAYDPEIYSGKYTRSNNTNFDCEAFISFQDSLYLFSKNWIDNKCYLYSLSKEPGTYIIAPKDTINTNGLVCGADYNENTNTIALIGYKYGIPAPSLLFIIKDFTSNDFFNGTLIRKRLSLNGCQTEAIIFRNNNDLWFTNENFLSYEQGLYKISYNKQGIDKHSFNSKVFEVFPNPAKNTVNISVKDKFINNKFNVELIDTSGRIIKKLKNNKLNYTRIKKINLSDVKSGKYIIRIFDKKTSYQTSLIVL